MLALDRSPRAVSLARAASRSELASGRLEVRQSAIEDFVRKPNEAPFDLAFAMRVGSLDGRHPDDAQAALTAIAAALTPRGRLFIDGGEPLKEIDLRPFRQARR